uniref:Uncharacterized protein n=1 Tax=Anguilla anguilla TaxID=7936 RepID=A0A0E9RA32_ANGAN
MCAHSNNPKHILNTPGSNKTSMKECVCLEDISKPLYHMITDKKTRSHWLLDGTLNKNL